MGGATHRDPWDKQGGPSSEGGEMGEQCARTHCQGGNPSGGGPSKPIAQRWTLVAANRRLNASYKIWNDMFDRDSTVTLGVRPPSNNKVQPLVAQMLHHLCRATAVALQLCRIFRLMFSQCRTRIALHPLKCLCRTLWGGGGEGFRTAP